MVPCTPPGCGACTQDVLVDSSPQMACASSVVHVDSLGHMPAAVLTQVLPLMSSDLCEAEDDHQHPREPTLAAELPGMAGVPVEQCQVTDRKSVV